MNPTVRIFLEKSDNDRTDNDKIWEANRDRIFFYQCHIQKKYNNPNPGNDILAIRWPTEKFLKTNPTYKGILKGQGFKGWCPKEVWLYHPLDI